MEKVKNFFKEIKEGFMGIGEKSKDIFKNNKRLFLTIVTKVLFGFVYFINLMLPFYYGIVFGTKIRVSVFGLKGPVIYLLIFFLPILLYALFGLNKKNQTANKVFKVHTILTMIMFVWFFLIFVVDTADVVGGVSLGFFINIILVAGMMILTWKENLIMSIIYKIFKADAVQEVEYVQAKSEVKVEPAPEPKPVPKPVPEPVPEPKPVVEPEPVAEPEPVVEPAPVDEPEPVESEPVEPEPKEEKPKE
ncbi:hypothetical protein RJI07_08965 [Mycoplasmatota bacterium WC30]